MALCLADAVRQDIESERQCMLFRKGEQGALSFAHCAYGCLLQTAAVHYRQEQIATPLQGRERLAGSDEYPK